MQFTGWTVGLTLESHYPPVHTAWDTLVPFGYVPHTACDIAVCVISVCYTTCNTAVWPNSMSYTGRDKTVCPYFESYTIWGIPHNLATRLCVPYF
ncbi:HTH-type transcriptional regulator yidZ [Gossypium arboreum]|uniref:HTH-type transcriptional regulator yidZ n=1 Tax=Gossypium arboreum TaxID=29729 RepID=A0A0B0MK55_GOSAR|nr:HTH-type transcriptional regulator yidZ [Gossypium arboreum]